MVFRFARFLHVVTLVFALVISPVAHALKIRVNAMAFMRQEQSGMLNHVSTLAPGAIVEVPDKYAVVDSNGRVNVELTLNNWLRNAGYEQSEIDGSANGQQSDYFFPVRVASTPNYSGVNPVGGTYYVALRNLARIQGALVVQNFANVYEGPEDDVPLRSGIRLNPGQAPAPRQEMSTTSAAHSSRGDDGERGTYSAPPPPPPPPEDAAPSRTEAQPPCTDCGYSPGSNGAIASLRRDVQPALERIASQTETNRRRTTQIDAIAFNMKATCGFDLADFVPEVERAARAHNVPSRVLLAIMAQESTGNCHLNDNQPNKGLFQINPNSKRRDIPLCTSAQKAQLRRIGDVRALRNGPQCLDNPVINAFEGARILRAKMDAVMNVLPAQSFRGNLNGYNSSAWRIAAQSYNHGEKWVMDAYNDMKIFNRRHQTNYSPTNWEDLKVFYLRSFLNEKVQRQHYGAPRFNRNSRSTIANLAYAENIVPTRANVPGRETTVEAWNRYVNSLRVR